MGLKKRLAEQEAQSRFRHTQSEPMDKRRLSETKEDIVSDALREFDRRLKSKRTDHHRLQELQVS